MSNNFWSATQMAGAGGALKALAKNVSNQLTLNSTEMKQVVARVISDCLHQGQMSDYNGHTFYLNPERIDMTKQITDSKEAFDDMVEQKRLRSKKTSQYSPSSSRSRSLTCRLAMGGQPRRSLAGVMINQHHLRHPTTDIVVEMPHRSIGSLRSKPLMKRKPTIVSIKRNKSRIINKSRSQAAVRPKAKAKPKLKSKSVGKMQSVIRSKPVSKKKSFVQRQTSTLRQARLPAGDAVRPMCSAAYTKAKPRIQLISCIKGFSPKTGVTTTRTNVMNHQKQRQSGRKVPNMRSQAQAHEQIRPKKLSSNKSRRLRAGSVVTKPVKQPKKKQWYNPYQFQGGAGSTQQTNPRPKSKAQLAHANKQLKSMNSIRRVQKKRSQERLARQLERDEAIDDLERLEASSMRSFRVKRNKGTKRGYKISARLEELALPAVRNRFISEPSTVCNSVSILPLNRPMKRQFKQRFQVDSSLGSIAAMKEASRSESLSPAKRNLTLAFMSNEGTRSPRSKRSVLWR